MARIDYGQVPPVIPDFENSRTISYRGGAKHLANKKYIDNQNLNSPNKSCAGFSYVGKNPKTGCWRIIWVRGYW